MQDFQWNALAILDKLRKHVFFLFFLETFMKMIYDFAQQEPRKQLYVLTTDNIFCRYLKAYGLGDNSR